MSEETSENKYNEPWSNTPNDGFEDSLGNSIIESYPGEWQCDHLDRIAACVNLCAGVPDRLLPNLRVRIEDILEEMIEAEMDSRYSVSSYQFHGQEHTFHAVGCLACGKNLASKAMSLADVKKIKNEHDKTCEKK